jgi:RNA polymerase sigma-70 factor (ECF subfamily)
MSSPSNGHAPAHKFAATLAAAQRGSSESLGRLLEPCRQYLLLIANQELNPTLAPKVGASDLVQETFLTARRTLRQFRGATEAELMGWLRQVLLNHLLTVQRRYVQAAKRSVRREVSLEDFIRLGSDAVTVDAMSPSKHFMRGELKGLVEDALARLPARYRQVIDLRHRQALAFEEVAQRLEITSQAARQLWTRAIKRLQKELRAAEMV